MAKSEQNYQKNSAEMIQKEYVEKLKFHLKEKEEQLKYAQSKLDAGMKDEKSSPADLNGLLGYRNEIIKDIREIEAKIKLLQEEGCQDSNDKPPRDKFGGLLIAGSGAVNIRNQKTEKDKEVLTYRDIIKKKDEKEKENEDKENLLDRLLEELKKREEEKTIDVEMKSKTETSKK